MNDERRMGVTFIFICLISLFIIVSSGCTTTRPYVQVFVGYRVGNDSFASCSKEDSGFRVGVEHRFNKWVKGAVEYQHLSHMLCGAPFNTLPEDDADHVGLTVTVGGVQ